MEARPRHRRNNPSFSSSLLDAIYRSIDESDLNLTRGAPDPTPRHAFTPSPAVTRLHYTSDTSSSSSSSYSADSARVIRPKPVRTGPVRTDPIQTQSDRIRSGRSRPDPQPQPPPQKQKKKLRDHLKKSTSPSPKSPGAKLALFLNSLFSTASNHKKPKIATEDPSPSPSSSSASRSCLSKTPSTRRSNGSARSVRFVIDGELTAVRARERRRMMVEELLKGMGMEMETETEEGEESDEDLFELENLAGIVTNELPVYGTTDLGMNSAISRGLIV